MENAPTSSRSAANAPSTLTPLRKTSRPLGGSRTASPEPGRETRYETKPTNQPISECRAVALRRALEKMMTRVLREMLLVRQARPRDKRGSIGVKYVTP